MAKQPAVKSATTVQKNTPAAPVKRPSKPGKAHKIFDYTRQSQSIRSDDDFQSYLTGYPDKTGIMAYIYRLLPAVDNSLAGFGENSIYKTAQPAEMNRDFLARKFGKGEYLLKLADANRPKGQNQACTTWFFINDPDLTPIYDPRTLKLGDPKNQDEIARLLTLGVLVRDSATGNPRLKTQGDEPAGATPAAVPASNGGGDLIGKDIMGQVLLKLITEGSKSPAESFKNAIEMAKLMQPAGAQQNFSVEQVAELVVAKLESRSQSGGGDIFQSYERVQSFITKIAPAAVAAAPEGITGWAAVAPQIMDGLDRLLTKVVTIVTARTNAGSVAQPVQPSKVRVETDPRPPQIPDLATRIAQIAEIGFQRMETGVNGFDFAAWVCNYLPGGLEAYLFLEPQGTAGVMGMAAMNPATESFMTDQVKRAKVENFLEQFFSYSTEPVVSEADPAAAASATA